MNSFFIVKLERAKAEKENLSVEFKLRNPTMASILIEF